MKQIRLSPSGPVLAQFGNGFVLQQAEATDVLESPDVLDGTATEISTDLRPELENVDSSSYIGVEVYFDAANVGTTVAAVLTTLQVSTDGGTTWQAAGTFTNGVGATAAADTCIREINNVRAGFPVSTLNDFEGSVMARVLASITAGDANDVSVRSGSQCYVKLVEYFHE